MRILLSKTEHPEKGSPVYPIMQWHAGEWLTTLHKALKPHEPGQGSLHFSLIHAEFEAHSEFSMHSGRQFGGLPM